MNPTILGFWAQGFLIRLLHYMRSLPYPGIYDSSFLKHGGLGFGSFRKIGDPNIVP